MPTARRTKAHPAAAESVADAVPPGNSASAAEATGPLRVLKKYPNRRLYDTRTSSYITLADVKKMVLGGEDFEVRDAKTADDLTRSILLQIILEEESAGAPMFTTPMLAQIIRVYGHAMQGMMGSLLEQNMKLFADTQAQMLERSKGLGPLAPEAWATLMGGQPVQEMMQRYAEQSRTLFEQMREAGSSFFPGLNSKR